MGVRPGSARYFAHARRPLMLPAALRALDYECRRQFTKAVALDC